jgi:hypothetical protein
MHKPKTKRQAMNQKADKYDRFAEWLRNEATDDQKDCIFLTQKVMIEYSRSRIIQFPASAGMK